MSNTKNTTTEQNATQDNKVIIKVNKTIDFEKISEKAQKNTDKVLSNEQIRTYKIEGVKKKVSFSCNKILPETDAFLYQVEDLHKTETKRLLNTIIGSISKANKEYTLIE